MENLNKQNEEPKKVSYADKVAQQVIEAIEAGTAPWMREWEGAAAFNLAPHNASTGMSYNGINAINLMLTAEIKGYSEPRWCTFKQAADLGAKVKKNEKGTLIQYWKNKEQVSVLDDDGKPVLDDKGKPIKETIKLKNPKPFYATVFNADQIDGLEPFKQRELSFEPNEVAEQILSNSGAKIEHRAGDKAFYRPLADFITLPLKEQFNSEGAYYATALHELGHWTGHESRLNRDLSGGFGSENYAKEELRAEIASFMLSTRIGIDFDPAYPNNHFAYIGSWIKVLQEKPAEIFKAANDAEKITNFIEGLNMEKTQHTEQSKQAKDEHVMIYNEIDAHLKEKNLQISDVLRDEYFGAALSLLDSDGGYTIAEAVQEAFFDIDKKMLDELAEKLPHIITTTNNKLDKQNYLYVPKEQKEAAKSVGCRWDAENKAWYAPKGTDLQAIQEWLPKNQEVKIGVIAGEAMGNDPIIAFREELLKRGFELHGDPVADGNFHRVKVAGDKGAAKSGSYRIHNDGRPNLYLKDFKNGIEESISHKDSYFKAGADDKAIEAQKEINRINNLQSSYERDRMYYAVAKRLQETIPNLAPAPADHPYLVKKGIEPTTNIKVDEKGNLVIPFAAKDSRANIRTAQKIITNDDGTFSKLFEKGGEKSGNWHTVGGVQKDILFVCEGFATGVSIKEATGYSVQVAGDSGNLKPVIENLININKNDTKVVIAADNDIYRGGGDENKGLTKAKEAMAYILEKYPDVKIAIATPSFTREEMQNKATDFNDIAKSRGLETVKNQINIAINKLDKAVTVIKETTQEIKVDTKKTVKQIPKQEAVIQPTLAR